MAAAHDAQATALQLSGERQALQVQLAAGANEVAVLRQMVAAVEREHREAVGRIQGRAADEVGRVQARAEAEIESAVVQARARAGREAEAASEGAGEARRPEDSGPNGASGRAASKDSGTAADPSSSSSTAASPTRHRASMHRGAPACGGSAVPQASATELQLEALQNDFRSLVVSAASLPRGCMMQYMWQLRDALLEGLHQFIRWGG